MDPSESPAMEIDTPLNQYEYQPIDPKDEMRILILLPPASPDETELHCEIVTANVSDKPSYEAISYCWELKCSQRYFTCLMEFWPSQRILQPG
jgi:hypothetical protein